MAPKRLPPELLFELGLFIPVKSAFVNAYFSCRLFHNILRPNIMRRIETMKTMHAKLNDVVEMLAQTGAQIDEIGPADIAEIGTLKSEIDGLKAQTKALKAELDKEMAKMSALFYQRKTEEQQQTTTVTPETDHNYDHQHHHPHLGAAADVGPPAEELVTKSEHNGGNAPLPTSPPPLGQKNE